MAPSMRPKIRLQSDLWCSNLGAVNRHGAYTVASVQLCDEGPFVAFTERISSSVYLFS